MRCTGCGFAYTPSSPSGRCFGCRHDDHDREVRETRALLERLRARQARGA